MVTVDESTIEGAEVIAKRNRETQPVTQSLFDAFAGLFEGVSLKGNTIKFPFGEFGVISVSPKLPGVTGGVSRGVTISYEACADALLAYISITGDMSASGYEKYRKDEANAEATSTWPSAHVIKNSNEGKWIANEVLKQYLLNLKNA